MDQQIYKLLTHENCLIQTLKELKRGPVEIQLNLNTVTLSRLSPHYPD